ncbi:MAG TPA: DUF1206 domain-containing protein [Nocardioides sp.]|nr:DUF1206 domain-containing protein [Nocardioides sp.]
MTSTRAASQAADSAWLEWVVRVGLLGYGVVHLLVAWLALQLAFGQRSGSPSQQGALHEIARQPAGAVWLWVVAVGFLGLAVWQAIEALWGHHREHGGKRLLKRVGSAGRVGVYGALGYSAARVASGAGSGSAGDSLTARLMAQPFGRWLVAAVGVLVVVVAISQAKRGWTRSFTKDLAGPPAGPLGTAVVRVGQAGYLAKAVAFAVVGALFVWAAWTYDPDKAGGLGASLATLREAGPGPWLLAVVAVGIGCFGVYCFAWARYADTSA